MKYKFIQDFKAFAMKWNVLDLAVAVIIGTAFWKIVSSLVADVITPLLGIILWWVNFSDLKFVYHESTITYWNFLQSIFDFMVISFSIFLFISIINKVGEKVKKKEEKKQEEAKKSDEVLLLQEIRDLLKKTK